MVFNYFFEIPFNEIIFCRIFKLYRKNCEDLIYHINIKPV